MNEAIQDSKVHDNLYVFKKQAFFQKYLNQCCCFLTTYASIFFRHMKPFAIDINPIFFDLGRDVFDPT